MRRMLILFLLLTTASFGSEKPLVRVRWRGSQLRISYKNKLMTYGYGDSEDVPEPFLYAIDKVRTDYLAEKKNVIYMILDVEGPSTGPEGSNAQCGAGTESAKILFVFDGQGEVRPPESVLYNSCYKNLEPAEDILTAVSTEHRIAITKFNTYLPGPNDHVITKSVTGWFDPENPGHGFTTTESCTDRDPASQSMKSESIPCPH
jgi:hypothetical protein